MNKSPIGNWHDLKQFGINALTGEACAYSMRVLCDLSEAGRTRIAAFFGGLAEDGFPANWNSRVGDDPAVASVMLPRGILGDLAKFLLFQDGALAVVETPGQWTGIYEPERLAAYTDYLRENPGSIRSVARNPLIGRNPDEVRGDRNVHVMTGRAS